MIAFIDDHRDVYGAVLCPRQIGSFRLRVSGILEPGWEEIQKDWRAIRQKAGIKDVRIHDLRHSFVAAGRPTKWQAWSPVRWGWTCRQGIGRRESKR